MAGLLNMTPQELYSALSAKIGPVDMRKISEGLQHGGLAPSFFVDEVCLALMGWDVTLRDIRWLELPSGAWSERLVTYFESQNALSNRIVLGFVKGSAHHCVLGIVNNGLLSIYDEEQERTNYYKSIVAPELVVWRG